MRVIATTNRLQIFDLFNLERIALHTRSRKLGEPKTDELHWPPEKRGHCDFTVEIAKKQFTQTKGMLTCFEHWFGPYPFYEDGYKLVEAPFASTR